jgi:hypothetical protein
MTGRLADVLVVGAGPTGLALAAQLAASGVRARLVDRGLDRVQESRALAIQPRTLEVLAGLGVTDELIACGNPAVQLRIHVPGRILAVPLFDLGLDDTAYPYLLLLSQAETERVLGAHLAAAGVPVERGFEPVGLSDTADAAVADPEAAVQLGDSTTQATPFRPLHLAGPTGEPPRRNRKPSAGRRRVAKDAPSSQGAGESHAFCTYVRRFSRQAGAGRHPGDSRSPRDRRRDSLRGRRSELAAFHGGERT